MPCLMSPTKECLEGGAALVVHGYKLGDPARNSNDSFEFANRRGLRRERVLQPVDDEVDIEFCIVRLQHLEQVWVVGSRQYVFTSGSERDCAIKVALVKEFYRPFDLPLGRLFLAGFHYARFL